MVASLVGLHIGLLMGSCVVCSGDRQNRTLEDICARQNRVLMGKNKSKQTHASGLAGSFTRWIVSWTSRGILCDISEEWAEQNVRGHCCKTKQSLDGKEEV